MSKPKLTPWFDGSYVPARAGWYETKLPYEHEGQPFPTKRRWCGSQWSCAEWMDASGRKVSLRQDWHWRGLAQDPKARKAK